VTSAMAMATYSATSWPPCERLRTECARPGLAALQAPVHIIATSSALYRATLDMHTSRTG